LSIAKLLVTLAAIAEGAFIQQASIISAREVSETVLLQAALAANLPQGYTANITGDQRSPTVPSNPFSGAFNNYTSRVSITNGFDGCPGVCTVNAPGVGFKVSCAPETTSTWTFANYSGSSYIPQFSASTNWKTVHDLPDGESQEFLTLSAGWAINIVTHSSSSTGFAIYL
jgi:hypothetical protein